MSDRDLAAAQASEENITPPGAKKRKLDAVDNNNNFRPLQPISPPPLRRRTSTVPNETYVPQEVPQPTSSSSFLISSPIKLTTIRDLPPDHNVDAVSLHDLIGDSSIVEMWQFNYLFDIDFMMYACADSLFILPPRLHSR